jgi:branched-chain amino acid transport system substrate-binding protein
VTVDARLLRHSRPRTRLAGAFALALAVVTGFGVEVRAQELRLGAIVPSSGPFAEWGRTNTAALKMLEEDVNAAGGVNGAKLKIVIYDDAAQPAQAANALRKLAGDDKVLAVAGPLTSSACEVTFPVANQLKISVMSQASSKPGVSALNRPWAFRNTIDEAVLAKTTVPFYKDAFKIKSVGIIYDAKDAVSTSIATRIFPGVMEANGVAVSNKEKPLSFNTGELDVSAQVTALKALNVDGVVIGADYSQAVTVIREMKRQGFAKPIIGGTPLISSAILKAAPEIPIIAPATFYAGMKGDRVEAFAGKLTPILRKTSGLPPEIEPSMYDANITEIIQMYIEAAKKSGAGLKAETVEADREKIRDYVTGIKDFNGWGGPISFNKDGDAVKAFYVVHGEKGAWSSKLRGCSSPDGKGC